MGSGRQAEHHDPGALVAETRNRSTPVLVVAVGGPLLNRYPLAPLDQTRARSTRHDLALQPAECGHGQRQ